MTYGLSVVGATSNIQIDSDQPYSYYRLIASGTGTSVTVSGLDIHKDLILAKPSAGTGNLNVSYSGTTITFYASANYYILRPSLTGGVTSTNYGLRIYNIDSQLAFDSGSFGAGEDVILQIANIIAAGQAGGNTGNSDSTVYTGTDYQSVYAAFNYSYYFTTVTWINGFFWSSATTTVRFSSYVNPFGTKYYLNNSSSLILAKVAIP